jgi:Glycosyl hydrolase family 63 C-terminal domain
MILGEGQQRRVIFSLVGKDRLRRILTKILDTDEFLSPHGIRALSKYHLDHPYTFSGNTVAYDPAESTSRLYGGNSNWRGPLWFPINYLFIESLQKYDYAYGKSFQIECPTGSGTEKDLWGVASDLSNRLSHLFLRDGNGRRPCFGDAEILQQQEHLLFHEYFHGDNGAGLGAMHQTGWTALVAKLLSQNAPQE